MTSDGLYALIKLRPVERGDASAIFATWGRYPENFLHLTARVFRGVEDAEAYVANLFETPDSIAFHIMEPRGAIVGIVKAAVAGHRAQVGYVVHQPFWGRGFATAAVRELVAILEAKPSISRVWATCSLDNIASARVLEKSGFEREAVLKNWAVYPQQGDRAFDNYSYVKLPRAAG